MTVNVIPVTDECGAITNADMLVAAEGVHRQLRPHLPHDYVALSQREREQTLDRVSRKGSAPR